MELFIFGLGLIFVGFVVIAVGRSATKTAGGVGKLLGAVGAGMLAMFIGVALMVGSTMVYISEDNVGVIMKKLGSDLPAGQIVARGGEKGVQAITLGPGWHFFFWPWIYEVTKQPVTVIPLGQIGVILASDGKPLGGDEVFAPEWKSINEMLDPTKFLNEGFKGPQLTVLPPGTYRINPSVYTVTVVPVTDVPVGQVAVIQANAGIDHTGEKMKLVNGVPLVPKGGKGIWNEALGPGQYFLHPNAYKVTKVITSNRVYEYQHSENKTLNDPVIVRSKDGFSFPVEVRVGVSVSPQNAPTIVALLRDPDALMDEGEDKGVISNLEARLVLPAIRTILRNVSESKNALEFLDTRSQVEKITQEKFKEAMTAVSLETEGVFIGQIDFDHNTATKALMTTRTDMEIAKNQKIAYEQQIKAEETRKEHVKAKTIADQQQQIEAATAQVAVKKQDSLARVQQATGEGEALLIIAKANKEAYELLSASLGKEGVTLLEILKIVKEGNIKITPDVMVTGSGNGEGSLNDALAGTILRGQMHPAAPTAKPAPK